MTSRCMLKCPVCPRVKQFDDRKFWDTGHIHIPSLIRETIPGIIKRVNMGGAYGDSIYHPQLLDYIKYLTDVNIAWNMDTNASYVNDAEKWHSIGKLATENTEGCTLNFSVDGTPDNFTQYRVNGQWSSIEEGMKILGQYPRLQTIWKYIVFRYNSGIEDMKTAYKLACDFKLKEFVLVHTTRGKPGQCIPLDEFQETLNAFEDWAAEYNKIHNLKTKLNIMIHPRVRQTRKEITEFVTKAEIKQTINVANKTEKTESKIAQVKRYNQTEKKIILNGISPHCLNVQGFQNFIGSNGVFYPCCYMRSDTRYFMEDLGWTEEDLELMSIHNYTINEIVQSKPFKLLMENFHKARTCVKKCSVTN